MNSVPKNHKYNFKSSLTHTIKRVQNNCKYNENGLYEQLVKIGDTLIKILYDKQHKNANVSQINPEHVVIEYLFFDNIYNSTQVDDMFTNFKLDWQDEKQLTERLLDIQNKTAGNYHIIINNNEKTCIINITKK